MLTRSPQRGPHSWPDQATQWQHLQFLLAKNVSGKHVRNSNLIVIFAMQCYIASVSIQFIQLFCTKQPQQWFLRLGTRLLHHSPCCYCRIRYACPLLLSNPTDQICVLGPEHNHCKNRWTRKVGHRRDCYCLRRGRDTKALTVPCPWPYKILIRLENWLPGKRSGWLAHIIAAF